MSHSNFHAKSIKVLNSAIVVNFQIEKNIVKWDFLDHISSTVNSTWIQNRCDVMIAI